MACSDNSLELTGTSIQGTAAQFGQASDHSSDANTVLHASYSSRDDSNTPSPSAKALAVSRGKLDCRHKVQKARRRTKYDYSQLVGKQVCFPASYFGVDEPGLFYDGKVVKRDPARPGYVIVSLKDDPARYFVRFKEVMHFYQQSLNLEQDLEADSETSACTSDAFDDADRLTHAADVLMKLKNTRLNALIHQLPWLANLRGS